VSDTLGHIRIITGCAAVHPDRRGGQHVAQACPGVLAIDDERGIGVLCMDERSQFRNRERALEMLKQLTETKP
jgi:protein subunit release factor A